MRIDEPVLIRIQGPEDFPEPSRFELIDHVVRLSVLVLCLGDSVCLRLKESLCDQLLAVLFVVQVQEDLILIVVSLDSITTTHFTHLILHSLGTARFLDGSTPTPSTHPSFASESVT